MRVVRAARGRRGERERAKTDVGLALRPTAPKGKLGGGQRYVGRRGRRKVRVDSTSTKVVKLLYEYSKSGGVGRETKSLVSFRKLSKGRRCNAITEGRGM